jgi:hypothetical protein
VALIEDRFEDTLLFVGGDAQRAAVVGGGDTSARPVVRTQGHHPADVAPTRAAIRDTLGIDAFVLGCREVTVADGVARRLVDVEMLSASDAAIRQERRWAEADEIAAVDHRAVVDGREWTQPGWFTRACAWLEDQATTSGWTIHNVEQIRTWEFSCVLRVQTDQGELYFKAMPESYAAEVKLVQQLTAWYPDHLPEVVAADEGARWLLLRACPGRCLEDGAPLATWRGVARTYADLQVASASKADRLRALGCPDRGPAALRAAIGLLLASDIAFLVDQEHGLTAAELHRLRVSQPWLEQACDELSTSNVPLTIEHGDLWASNVYVSNNAPTFIDWTDACLSHPFLSLGPLLRSAGWDTHLRDDRAMLREIGDAYLEAWSTFASRTQLRRELDLAQPLAALHIARTIWSHTPGSHQQWWLWRMVPFFARVALELLPAAGVL